MLGTSRGSDRHGRVPGDRHGDQRAGRRRLRDDRGRHGARRRRRAPRPMELARARGGQPAPRDQAAHGHQPGDARRRPRARGRRPGARRAAPRPRARGAQRAVRPPGAAPGVRSRRRRVAGSAGAVHGGARAGAAAAPARAPARRARRLARDRGRDGAPGTAGCGDVRAGSSARCSRGCARTRRRWRTRSRCCGHAERAALGPGAREPATGLLPQLDFSELPRDPGVYLFRDEAGRTLYVGKSISIRSRARAHFAPSSGPADWSPHASVVDYNPTCSELGALVLENRLIKELAPSGKHPADECRRPARLHPLPARHPVPDPRGLAAARGGPRGHDRPAPWQGARPRARRADRLAVRPAPLRPPAAAPRAPVRLRADGPLPVSVPRGPRPEPLPPPPR